MNFTIITLTFSDMNRLCGLRIPVTRSLKISSNFLARNQSGRSTLLTSEKKKLKVEEKFKTRTYINYGLALMFTFWGLAFWAVPFYRVFCESDGKSWTEALTGVRANHDSSKVSQMEPDYDRPLVVRFLSTWVHPVKTYRRILFWRDPLRLQLKAGNWHIRPGWRIGE